MYKRQAKVSDRLSHNNLSTDNIQALLESYLSNSQNKKVIFAEKDRQKIVDPQDIILVKAEGNYATVYLDDNTQLTLSMTLKAIEQKLNFDHFLRIHHSYLVNMDKVVQYSKTDGGFLVMKNGDSVPISRAKKPVLKSYLEKDFK